MDRSPNEGGGPPRGRSFAALQVAAVLAAAAASMATSPLEFPRCIAGTTPFDGQTGVALDGPLTVIAMDLPASLPRLGGTAFRLEQVNGEATVELPVTVRRADRQGQPDGRVFATWTVEPDAPLVADARYRLIAVDLAEVDSAHHSPSFGNVHDDFEWPVVEHDFTTASAPRLMAAVTDPGESSSDQPTVRLLFSEPMDLDSLAEHTTIVGADDQVLTVVGPPSHPPGLPHLVEFTVERDLGDDPSTWTVRVGGDAIAIAGGRMHGAGVTLAEAEPPGTEAVWRVDDDQNGPQTNLWQQPEFDAWVALTAGHLAFCEPSP